MLLPVPPLCTIYYHVPNNSCPHRPTYVPVMLTPLSVLRVCGVGCIPIASTITPISSLLSILSACNPNLLLYKQLYLSSAAPTVLLMTLPPVSENSPLSADLLLPVVIFVLIY